ncbi:ead/Ea22-like family protein [Scandinavium sp.]|uniref:ead/Ea22-like family protein n=1 Tax=Scandinavium sp. TaxID=2830653 RepID=UPI0028A1C150|nr:ead/Ea22-like family protein [Scandinavium sp.]
MTSQLTPEQIAELRELAQAAWGKWQAYKPHKGARGYEVKNGVEAVAQHALKRDAEFIAAADPVTILVLMDALEARDKRIAEQRMLLKGADAIQTDYAEALECQDDNDSVLAAIVALKKRAESAEQALLLEKQKGAGKILPIALPPSKFCPAEYAGSVLWNETEIWNKAIEACSDALRAAGISLQKGDE